MSRIDIFLEEKAKNLIDSFARCFKARISIFSVDFEEKLAAEFYPATRYCELVREKLGVKHRCLEQDRKMCHYSLKIASPQCYVCHAGMVDAAVPIKGDGLKGRGGGGIDRIRHDRPIQDA